jgi:hypothetical protein
VRYHSDLGLEDHLLLPVYLAQDLLLFSVQYHLLSHIVAFTITNMPLVSEKHQL